MAAQAQMQGLPFEDDLAQPFSREATEVAHPPAKKKSIVELIAPLRGIDIDFIRNHSNGRPVEL